MRTVIFLISFAFMGCGSANFKGSSKSTPPKGKEANAAATENHTLTWLWPCGAGNSKPKVNGKNMTLSGPGPHIIDPSLVDGANLTIKGNACSLSAQRRSVLFVIDVSGSMSV